MSTEQKAFWGYVVVLGFLAWTPMYPRAALMLLISIGAFALGGAFFVVLVALRPIARRADVWISARTLIPLARLLKRVAGRRS
jgi:hypothetical protein